MKHFMITLGIIAIFLSTTVFAKQQAQSSCETGQISENSTKVNYSLPDLDDNIKNLKHDLVKFSKHHGWRISKRNELKRELTSLKSTRQKLVDNMYIAGCDKLHDQASMSAKVKKLEHQLAVLKESASQ